MTTSSFDDIDIADDLVAVRTLSHETTKVIADLEATPRLRAVTRQGKIVAVLIPTSMPSLFHRWLALSPKREDAMRDLVRDVAPGLEFGHLPTLSTSPDGPPIVSVGIKEFAKATSEYLRRAEDGEWVFLRRHGRPIALLVRFSLPELMRLTLELEGADPRAAAVADQILLDPDPVRVNGNG